MPETRINNEGRRIPIGGKGSHARTAIDGVTLASVKKAPLPPPRSPVTVRTCQFPMWGWGRPPKPPVFCDKPVVRDRDGLPVSPYCASHRAVCCQQSQGGMRDATREKLAAL